jgi:hypothetical protein
VDERRIVSAFKAKENASVNCADEDGSSVGVGGCGINAEQVGRCDLRGAEVTMPAASVGANPDRSSALPRSGWHMPGGQIFEKFSKEMASRQMPGVWPNGTLAANDQGNNAKRKQVRPRLAGEGVEDPYAKFVESSWCETRNNKGEDLA